MIAKENDIDLRNVKPSGRKDRVTKEDIIMYMEDPVKYGRNEVSKNQLSNQSIYSSAGTISGQPSSRNVKSVGYGEQTIVSMNPVERKNCQLMK